MVTLKDLGENVEVSILVPVVAKELGNTYSGSGFTPADLKSYGFHITVTAPVLAEFVGELAKAFFELQHARAEKIKLQQQASSG